MGNFEDPFTGYSTLLRIIIFGAVPAFTILQYFRLKRALHVFQLEGYKRDRFLRWCRDNTSRARWLRDAPQKKPLVMTGRAWRLLVASLVLIPVLILVPAGIAHIALGGWPIDVLVWAAATVVLFFGTSRFLVLVDGLLSPVQRSINEKYLRAARRRLQETSPLVIGVTGSFGKTSTKFAIEGLVGPRGSALATPGSFNTPLGVSRTINGSLAREHRYFVVEMGAYKEGEIAELCDFVHPSIGVLTAIGPAHLERFGSLDAIRRAKYEIVTGLPPEGTAVMNVDDAEVRRLADRTTGVRVVRYGIDPGAAPDVTAVDVRTTSEGTDFTLVETASGDSMNVSTRLLGRHSVGHVLAGVAVARIAGRPLAETGEAIASLPPVEHRLQLIEGAGGVIVIDDAYNSNPEGAAAALEVLEQMPARRKVVVTPGIIELGDMQAEANRSFGRRASEVADVLIVVARPNRDAIRAGADGGRAEVVAVDSLADATKRLAGLLEPGDAVLFENDLPDQYEGP
jgi:UDP-N-acetylmuramoyl-tripeptide--D-alanyl-D-alanine ligase